MGFDKVPLEFLPGEIKLKNNKKIVNIEIYDATRAFSKAINFKNFYNNLHNFLESDGFTDVIEVGKKADPVDLPDKKVTKSHDMYEVSFLYADREEAGKEYDITWKAKKEISSNGMFYIKINIVNRFFKDVDGLQDGKWEIAISANYENNIAAGFSNTFLGKFLNHFCDIEVIAYKYVYRNILEKDFSDVDDTMNNILSFFERELS